MGRETSMVSPSGEVCIVLRRGGKRFRWRVYIREALVADGRRSDDLLGTLWKLGTQGDRWGEAANELRRIAEALEEM